jgi:hypothetical protein
VCSVGQWQHPWPDSMCRYPTCLRLHPPVTAAPFLAPDRYLKHTTARYSKNCGSFASPSTQSGFRAHPFSCLTVFGGCVVKLTTYIHLRICGAIHTRRRTVMDSHLSRGYTFMRAIRLMELDSTCSTCGEIKNNYKCLASKSVQKGWPVKLGVGGRIMLIIVFIIWEYNTIWEFRLDLTGSKSCPGRLWTCRFRKENISHSCNQW